MHYDIVIIGGGPAGSSAGLTLSKINNSVCIIDKASFPRAKLCAGIITQKTVQTLKKILPDYKFSDFHSTNKISLFSQHDMKCEFSVKYPLTLVEREQFDYELLLACKKSGVHVLEQTSFSDLAPDRNKLILSTGEELTYNVLIAADGIFSKTRRKLGVADIPKGFCLQNVINISSQNKAMLTNLDKIYFDFANIPFGYNWILSNNKNIIIGTGILADTLSYKHAFTEHAKLCSQSGISSSMNLKGAFLPIGYIANQACHPYGNIVFIGDAAGFANPITGEGIYYAVLSGYYAGKAYLKDNIHFRDTFLSLFSPFINSMKDTTRLSRHFYSEKLINNLIFQLKNCPDYISGICDDVFSLEQRSYQDFFNELTDLFR